LMERSGGTNERYEYVQPSSVTVANGSFPLRYKALSENFN